MSHYLVEQKRYARTRLRDALAGLSADDAKKRLGNANSITWIVGHLASYEHNAWVVIAQGKPIDAGLQKFGFGQPASTPDLEDIVARYEAAVSAADVFLDSLTDEGLRAHLKREGEPMRDNIGTLLTRYTMHDFYHIGEVLALRQVMGHENLAQLPGAFPPGALFS